MVLSRPNVTTEQRQEVASQMQPMSCCAVEITSGTYWLRHPHNSNRDISISSRPSNPHSTILLHLKFGFGWPLCTFTNYIYLLTYPNSHRVLIPGELGLASSSLDLSSWPVWEKNLWRLLPCSTLSNQHSVAADLYPGSAYIAIFGNTHVHAQATGSTTTEIYNQSLRLLHPAECSWTLVLVGQLQAQYGFHIERSWGKWGFLRVGFPSS